MFDTMCIRIIYLFPAYVTLGLGTSRAATCGIWLDHAGSCDYSEKPKIK